MARAFNRLKFAAQLRKQKRKIKGVEYNETLAASYAIAQIKIVRYITKIAMQYLDELKYQNIVRDSIATFRNYVKLDSQEWIAKSVDAAAVNAVKRIDKYHRDKFVSEFKNKAGIDLQRIVKAEKLEVGLNRKIKENIGLITKANAEQLERIENTFKAAIMTGQESVSLQESIEQLGSVFESRAKLIARDQTSKFVSELNKERQTNVGIPGYYWRTAGDEAVRESHRENDGLYFDWDNPPAETGHPGDDIQCRCVADPAIDRFIESLPEE